MIGALKSQKPHDPKTPKATEPIAKRLKWFALERLE